jgi:hypothetical protein
MEMNLINEPDKFSWHLTTSGVYSVKFVYADYMNAHTRFLRKYGWNLKVTLKIKIFMWFLNKKNNSNKRLLSKKELKWVHEMCFL